MTKKPITAHAEIEEWLQHTQTEFILRWHVNAEDLSQGVWSLESLNQRAQEQVSRLRQQGLWGEVRLGLPDGKHEESDFIYPYVISPVGIDPEQYATDNFDVDWVLELLDKAGIKRDNVSILAPPGKLYPSGLLTVLRKDEWWGPQIFKAEMLWENYVKESRWKAELDFEYMLDFSCRMLNRLEREGRLAGRLNPNPTSPS